MVLTALSISCNASSLNPQPQDNKLTHQSNNKGIEKVKSLLKARGVSSSIKTTPLQSLQNGNWVKLICGASFEDVVDIRNLSVVYTLAGVDCIDCAADGSVVTAVNEGIEAARAILPLQRPWVMISVNDHEDLHFRKARNFQPLNFDPDDCPLDCSRPCEKVCPANAILLTGAVDELERGVVTERCYGCGRCFPVCPYDRIREITYVRDAAATAELLERDDVDAVEIHTSGRQTAFFKELWDGLDDSVSSLRLVAVSTESLLVFDSPSDDFLSLPDIGDSTTTAMNMMYSIMEPELHCFNLWQLDGRPMSGDIGRGATREAIAFAVHLAAAKDKPPGFLQLAGGTNAYTVEGSAYLEDSNDEKPPSSRTSSHALIGGIAYGGYACKIVGKILNAMKDEYGHACIEDHPQYLSRALIAAIDLVGPVKCFQSS